MYSEIFIGYSSKFWRIILTVEILERFKLTILSVFRGMGQIFLQENSLTGLLFLISLCFDSYSMAFVSLFCTVISTLTAYILRFNRDNIIKGLYGFNAALIGQAMIFYFEINGLVMLGAIIGSILSACMMEIFLRKKLPPYTFPFISITWVLLALLKIGEIVKDRPPGPITDYEVITFSDFAIPAKAFGQVIFQGHILAGLLTVLGIFLESPQSAYFGIIATMVSVSIAYSSGQPESNIRAGLCSFNAVLSGIACQGTRVMDGIYMIMSTIVSTYFFFLLIKHDFTTLTFPFVVSLWMVVIFKYFEKLIVNRFNQIFKQLPSINIENNPTTKKTLNDISRTSSKAMIIEKSLNQIELENLSSSVDIDLIQQQQQEIPQVNFKSQSDNNNNNIGSNENNDNNNKHSISRNL